MGVVRAKEAEDSARLGISGVLLERSWGRARFIPVSKKGTANMHAKPVQSHGFAGRINLRPSPFQRLGSLRVHHRSCSVLQRQSSKLPINIDLQCRRRTTSHPTLPPSSPPHSRPPCRKYTPSPTTR